MSKKVHIAGVGGEGWSWIAKMLIEKGWNVSGCDVAEGGRVKFLKSIGLNDFCLGNSSEHITSELDYFLYTSAILSDPDNKKELDKAIELGVKSFDRNVFFPELLSDRDVIGIAGTHGKTTTSSLTAYLIDALGDDCGFGVGGTVQNFDTNGRNGTTKNFVIEADEFGDAFLGLNPYVSVVTNMEWDHHDYFKTEEQYEESFVKYINNTQDNGLAILFGEVADKLEQKITKSIQVITYGNQSSNDFAILNVDIDGFNTNWDLVYKGETYKVTIPFPGKQFAQNSTAAIAVAVSLGHPIENAIKQLKGFKGAGRRFEKHEVKGLSIVNDYAHHPTEIKVTVDAAVSTGKKVCVLYEPHQYNRSYELKNEFVDLFNGIDQLFQTDIYASREQPPYLITNKDFFDITSRRVSYSEQIGDWDNSVEKISSWLKENDFVDVIILILAVGHGDKITDSLINKIKGEK